MPMDIIFGVSVLKFCMKAKARINCYLEQHFTDFPEIDKLFVSEMAVRIKVQIGASRSQPQVDAASAVAVGQINNNNITEFPEGFDSNVALANYCNASYLKSKRKLSQDSESQGMKILTIHSDQKTKKTFNEKQPFDYNAPANQTEQQRTDSGPRVEIINGKIVIKESSLLVADNDPTIAETDYEEIEEGIHSSSKYSSFVEKKNSSIWGIEETRKFYKALQQCGTEFSIMETFLPNRTRKELKKKFFREENRHPELIKRALDASVPLEMDQFEVAEPEDEIDTTASAANETIEPVDYNNTAASIEITNSTTSNTVSSVLSTSSDNIVPLDLSYNNLSR